MQEVLLRRKRKFTYFHGRLRKIMYISEHFGHKNSDGYEDIDLDGFKKWKLSKSLSRISKTIGRGNPAP